MAANAEGGLDTASSAGFAAAYAVMRLILVAQYLRASLRPGGARRLALDFAIGFGIAAGLWLTSAIAPQPLRYWLWAVAMTIDLATAVYASRHTRSIPPHAAHLPERFGLFTLILLGEAIVAIMKGIQAQPDWSVFAAGTALSGVGLLCAFWWWYFETAEATAHRHVRSHDDVKRLEIWSSAHLPLYLGLALTGVGVEHLVTAGGLETVHAGELALLALALLTASGALTVLSSAACACRAESL
jgi:low temperature requirement protein LtrA